MRPYTMKDMREEFTPQGMTYLLASLFETYKLKPNENFQVAINRAIEVIKSEPLLKDALKEVRP